MAMHTWKRFITVLLIVLNCNANAQRFYTGHDLSSLKLLDDSGTIYKDTSQGNVTRPAEDILKDGGMNTVRLR